MFLSRKLDQNAFFLGKAVTMRSYL